MLTALTGFARNGHAKNTSMTILYNSEIDQEDLEVLDFLAKTTGLKLVAHEGGVSSFQSAAVQVCCFDLFFVCGVDCVGLVLFFS